jgi:hypothetical protein
VVHGGLASLGEAVSSGAVSLQGGLLMCCEEVDAARPPHMRFLRVKTWFRFAVVAGRSTTMDVWLEVA